MSSDIIMASKSNLIQELGTDHLGLVNRPGIARAVLHTASSLINSVTQSAFS